MLISWLGNWMQNVANSWLLLQLTNSPFLLGLQGLFTSLPFIAGSLIGGSLADRMDRRRLITITQSCQLASAALQGLLVSAGAIQVWHIYLFGAFNWTVGALDAAGRQALLPDLVPRSHLSSAVALQSSLRRGSAILGPALGGVAIAALGLAGAYWANALSYVPVVLALSFIRTPSRAHGERRSMLASMKDGLKYAGARPLLAGLLGLEAANGIFGSSTPLMAVFARDILHVGAEGLGVLLAVLGVGAIVGAASMVAAGPALVSGRFLILTTLISPLPLIAFALSRSYALSLAMLLMVGALDMISGTLRSTAVQLNVDDSYRGRTMGLWSISGRGVSPLGGIQGGAIASLLSAPAAVTIGSVLTVLWTAFTAARIPEIRRFEVGKP